MCGFGGVINHKTGIDNASLTAAAHCVRFRGPDSSGIRVLNEALGAADRGAHGLFFNRLAIVDLDERSNQPFEDADHILIFNGEIYNYQELRSELQAEGARFHTTSDTEVLFQALKRWNTAAISRLNGMFAFFWLDKAARTFIICRDRLGIKPVYYHTKGKEFVFASELYTVMRLTSSSHTISTEAAEQYLRMQFVPTPLTIIKDIFKLPPGSYLRGHLDETQHTGKPEFYWDAYEEAVKIGERKHSLEEVLRRSLGRQLHADVPLGLFLSSGVDSSLLAALVNKYFSDGKDVNFFTVEFEEATTSDESTLARTFIEGFHNTNLHCHTIKVNPSFVEEHLDRLYEFFDEPFADHASILNWIISARAREKVTVAISGDGADELFWGYQRYNRWQKFTRLAEMPVAASIARRLSQMLPPNGLRGDIQYVLEKDPVKRHFNFFLSSGLRKNIPNGGSFENLWAAKNTGAIIDRADLTALLDIKTYLADAMLYKVDRASMATSLEVRVPYLDNETLEYALHTPLKEKSTARFLNKAPLRELLMQLAPHYPENLPKRGFNFPLGQWMKNNWRHMITSIVNEENLELAGLESKPLIRLVSDYYESKNNYFTDVWCIFNLALWIRANKDVLGTKST